MSSNRLTNKDLENATSFNNALKRDFLQSERNIKATSYNQQGVIKRTLSARTVGDVLSGSTLIGNIDYNNIFMAKFTQSQLENTIGAYGDSFMSTELNADGQKISLQGSAGFTNFLSNTLLSRQGSQDVNTLQDFLESSLTSEYGTVDSSSYDNIGNPNSNAVSSGSMEIALDSIISERGIKEYYIERGTLLSQMMGSRLTGGGRSQLISGFDFDIPDNLTGLTSTGSFFTGSSGSSPVTSTVITQPKVKAFVSAALIELLIIIENHTDIFLDGGFGLDRAANSSIQGPNRQPARANDNISDHVFGRAFDIMGMGDSESNVAPMPQDAEGYNAQLVKLLTVLENVPDHLKPDLIVVHSGLIGRYGIGQGLEGENTQIKRQFPGLRYVNFHADDGHVNHIHISFSGERAGVYTGPGGEMNTGGNISGPITGNNWADVTFGPGVATAFLLQNPKYTSDYSNSNLPSLTKKEIFDLLVNTVLSPEAAAVFVGITVRESSRSPVLINGGWKREDPNRYTKEYSVGLFQVNMRTDAHGGKTFYLPLGPESVRSIKGWQLAVDPNKAARSPWNTPNLTDSSINMFLRNNLGKVNRLDGDDPEKVSIANPALWIPLNQVFMLPVVFRGTIITFEQASIPSNRIGSDPTTGYIFSPWGDYEDGPEKGFLHNVKYSDVIEAYLETGKTEEQFKSWFRQMMNSPSAAGSRSRPHVETWLSGQQI